MQILFKGLAVTETTTCQDKIIKIDK